MSDNTGTPAVWNSMPGDDWTLEEPGRAVCGTLADIAALLPQGDYYLAENETDEWWVIVTLDGTREIAECPTEEEAVALIGALRGTEGAR